MPGHVTRARGRNGGRLRVTKKQITRLSRQSNRTPHPSAPPLGLRNAMPPHDTAPVLPAGYTFLNETHMVSKVAWKRARELLEKADRRDPDVHDMYVYNGESLYA